MSNERKGRAADGSDDSYYVSITDMLVGLIFLFIIMLMYYATQLREVTSDITSAEQTRTTVVRQVADYMFKRKIDVTVDEAAGVIRFPSEALFKQGSDAPLPQGDLTLSTLAEALAIYLPCYSFSVRPPDDGCTPAMHHVDSVLIEGHTDSQSLSKPRAAAHRGATPVRDNWELSTARAASVYRRILAAKPELDELFNAPISAPVGVAMPHRLFGIAGYADQRPLPEAADDPALNRRVEIRFVMALPDAEGLNGSDGLDREEIAGDPVHIDQRVQFTVDRQKTDAYLRRGWSWREAWGVWAVGNEATITLPLADFDPAAAHELTLQLVAFVPEQSPRRSVQLEINGTPVATWDFVGPRNSYRETVTMPANMLKQGEPLRLRFITINPASPKDLKISTDDRKIAVGLTSLVVRKAR